MNINSKRVSLFISYSIGLPLGLAFSLLCFVLPTYLSGEGLATMALVAIYGKAIIGLIIAFVFGLGIGSLVAHKNILNEFSLLNTSFQYSLIVNVIIWISFIVITIISNFENFSLLYIIPPAIAFILSTLLTTFTIGLLICYLIRRSILKTNYN